MAPGKKSNFIIFYVLQNAIFNMLKAISEIPVQSSTSEKKKDSSRSSSNSPVLFSSVLKYQMANQNMALAIVF